MAKQGKHKGIEVRTGVDGKISYRAKVHVKPHPTQTATFLRLTDAVRWRQQTAADLRRDKYFETAEARKHTFGELIDRYIATILPRKPKSEKKQTAQLLWWKGEIGSKRLLSEVKTSLIVEKRDLLLTGITYRHTHRSGACVNRYLAILSHVFSVAVNEWQWLEVSPMKQLKLKESNPGTVDITDEEFDRLIEACKRSENKYLYIVVQIAAATGCRLNEILGLRRDCVISENNNCILKIADTKNKTPHQVYLFGLARDLLINYLKENPRNSSYTFPATKGVKDRPAVIRAAWDEAVRLSGLAGKKITFHSLRRMVGTKLSRLDFSDSVIGKVLNQKSSSVTKRYIKLKDNDVKTALRTLINETNLSKEII